MASSTSDPPAVAIPQFVADGPDHVVVHGGKQNARRVPNPLALRLYLASDAGDTGGNHGHLVLSLCTPCIRDPVFYLWFTTRASSRPEWPDFAAPSALREYRASIRSWFTLPPGGEPQDILRAQERRERREELQRSNEIQSRCDKIIQDGTSDAYEESLDFYTTLRVKCAFHRMNQEGLVQRLREVQQARQALHTLLQTHHDEYEPHFVLPDLEKGATLGEELADDPNVLCFPTREDFDNAFLSQDVLAVSAGGEPA